jgi:hypothetical protein
VALWSNGRRINRRAVLRGGAGIVVALPFLDSLAGPSASAQLRENGPQRFFAFTHVQGWALGDSMPDAGFNLPPVMSDLDPVKEKCLFLSGIDNRVTPGGHNPTQRSQFSAMPSYGENEYFDNIFSSGPSVDEVVANRIANGGPKRRLDLCNRAGSPEGLGAVDSPFFWHGDADAVTHLADPQEVFMRVFGSTPPGEDPPPEVDLLLVRRRSVLDTVLGHFNSLRARVSVEDRRRLDQHADKIREIEQVLTGMPMIREDIASCMDRPAVPDTERYRELVPEISNVLVDLAVLASACGTHDVVTMVVFEGQYQWLGNALLDEEIAASEGRYHLLFHKFSDAGDNGRPREATNVVNRWNMSLFARYLRGLDAIEEADGTTALDHTLGLFVPEFGHGGGHASGNLPAVLAGNMAGVEMGRYLQYVSDLETPWGGASGAQTTNQLHVSILNAFGDDTDSFGDYSEGSIPRGGLSGL